MSEVSLFKMRDSFPRPARKIAVAQVDTYREPDADGNVWEYPVMASEEELRQREVDALKRELAGVEDGLAHVDDVIEPLSPFYLTAEAREQRRAGLEATRENIYAKLAALGESIEKPKPKKARKRS